MFYLRPLLKGGLQYAFSPSSLAVELGSGDSKEVTFQATRVSYSATGIVTLLSGQPKGVSVEARSESKGYYEDTVTHLSGSFRLRRLLPDTTYVMKAVQKDTISTRIERASPEFVSIKVGTEDIKGLDFVVFEQPETTILSGNVEGKKTDESHSNLLVEIKTARVSSKTESVFPLPLSKFFKVKNLPKGKYLVQLRSNVQSSTLKFKSDIIEVDLENAAQVHAGPLRYKFERHHQKQELTAAPLFALTVGLCVIAFFISMPRLKGVCQTAGGISSPEFRTTARKEPRKPAVRKKTY